MQKPTAADYKYGSVINIIRFIATSYSMTETSVALQSLFQKPSALPNTNTKLVFPSTHLTNSLTMQSTKPTILLIHGAYCTPDLFGDLPARLLAVSFPILTVQLPSADNDPTATVSSDIEAIHKVMLPTVDAGGEVVLVAHSYVISASP